MSNSNVLHKLDNEEISALIKNKECFTLTNVKNFLQSVKTIERLIENNGLSCRVYTAGRSTTMAAALASGPAVLLGLASAVAITTHNLVTRNPDYEIAKYPLADKLVINFKK